MWDYFEPREMIWYRWRLDGAMVFLKKNGEEWRLALSPVAITETVPDSGGPEESGPPAFPMGSFVVAEGRRVALRPFLSKMPYVVVARNDIRILPGSEAYFDVSLPPMVRFELEGGIGLQDFQPFGISRTWFGDKASGSLCLSLPAALDPRCRDEKEAAVPGTCCAESKSTVRCSLLVRNESKSPMELKRLAIYTDMLSVYEKDGFLRTDTVRVNGLADGTLKMGIHAEGEGPGTGKGRVLAQGTTVGIGDLLIRQGMHFLRTITDV